MTMTMMMMMMMMMRRRMKTKTRAWTKRIETTMSTTTTMEMTTMLMMVFHLDQLVWLILTYISKITTSIHSRTHPYIQDVKHIFISEFDFQISFSFAVCGGWSERVMRR